MKKAYKTPHVEAVKFEYKDQVVANSGGGQCKYDFRHAEHGCGDTPVYKTTQCMV